MRSKLFIIHGGFFFQYNNISRNLLTNNTSHAHILMKTPIRVLYEIHKTFRVTNLEREKSLHQNKRVLSNT